MSKVLRTWIVNASQVAELLSKKRKFQIFLKNYKLSVFLMLV